MARASADYQITATDKTDKAFRSVRQSLRQTSKAVQRFATVAVAGAVAGLGAYVRNTLAAADETTKLARDLGTTTQLLAEMEGVLTLAGGDMGGFTTGLRKMNENLAAVGKPSQTVKDALAALGLTFEEVARLTPDEKLALLIRRLEGMTDASARVAVAQAIFGRGQRTMIRLVDMGSEAIEKHRKAQAAMGNTLDQETGEAAERFNDTMATLAATLSGKGRKAVLDNVEALEQLAEGLVDVLGLAGKVAAAFLQIGSFLGETTARGVMAVEDAAQGAQAFVEQNVARRQVEPAAPPMTGGFGMNREALRMLQAIERNTAGPARAG